MMNFKLGFDLLFFAIIGAATASGVFLGDEKSQRLAIGVLIGSFAVTQFSEPIEKALGGRVAAITPVLVSVIIMARCVLACLIGKNVRDKKWPKSIIKSIILGVLSGLVAIAYVIASIPAQLRYNLVTDHNLAAMVYDLRIYLAAALIIALLVTFMTVGKAKK